MTEVHWNDTSSDWPEIQFDALNQYTWTELCNALVHIPSGRYARHWKILAEHNDLYVTFHIRFETPADLIMVRMLHPELVRGVG